MRLETFTEHFDAFLHGLRAAENTKFEWGVILDATVERYRSHFLTLAAKVQEFMIWAMLGEGAAARNAVAGLRADIAAALDSQRNALARVESLLALGAGHDGTMSNLRVAIAQASRGVLEQPIVPEDTQAYGPDITFLTAGEIYINPRYRLARSGGSGGAIQSC